MYLVEIEHVKHFRNMTYIRALGALRSSSTSKSLWPLQNTVLLYYLLVLKEYIFSQTLEYESIILSICSCECCEYKKKFDFSICGINLKHLLVVQLDREDHVVQLSPKKRKKSVNINFHPVVEMDHWECGFKPTKM